MLDQEQLAELYPDGRTFFYEGNSATTFIQTMDNLGLDVEVTIRVHVPLDRLAEFNALNLEVGT